MNQFCIIYLKIIIFRYPRSICKKCTDKRCRLIRTLLLDAWVKLRNFTCTWWKNWILYRYCCVIHNFCTTHITLYMIEKINYVIFFKRIFHLNKSGSTMSHFWQRLAALYLARKKKNKHIYKTYFLLRNVSKSIFVKI